ncbi:MAG TPA: restriction endonuclease, partial [Desulfobacterales bacterium]|nr:restriction endonuclease [Desulfobacterales bacterium]
GPPGTGKTYQLNKLVEKYSSNKQRLSREAWLIQELLDARWFDVVFAALFDLDREVKVSAIANHEYVQLKAKALGRDRNIAQTIWSTLQAHTREHSDTVQYKARSAPLVFDKNAQSLWSLVDNWKEECQEQIELAGKWKTGPKQEGVHHRFEFVTFHQAYSYEDFVEGIRPVQNEETSELEYQVVPGVFRRICQRAKADSGQQYAIFIDEINRGNIAKIFGELITLIEVDKRATYDDSGERKSGMELTLPYSGSRFSVPANLDLYGTMNTADRSIALLDTALRRRFHFKELMPDSGVISGSRGDGYIEDGEGGVVNLRALLDAMNRRIRFLLNRDMTLGHAYFINVRDFRDLREVLFNQIMPLLQEYFYEDWHRIQLVFRDVGAMGEKLEPQIICHQTLNEEEVLGFDHDDYEDLTEYRVTSPDEITPDAIRKVYEEGA